VDRANLDPEVESFRRRNERVAAYTDVRKLLESKDIRSRIIHVHDLHDPKYPYPLMVDLLVKANWAGWALAARGDTVPDRVGALIEQRRAWEAMIEKARGRASA